MKPILLDFPDEIWTPRLHIRAPRPGDGAAVSEAVNESLDELRPWMPWAQHGPTPEESEEVSRRAHARFLLREDLSLWLFDRATGEFVGGSGLHRINWDVPKFEIGYWLRTSRTGHGYMTEAVEAITAFVFETLHARRVEIRCDARNTRSAGVAERAGFTLEGILHNYVQDVSGALTDVRVHARVR
ncbi:MAG TPA: GNAT family N-acetyltransferase [Abditibacteriaceae bacterium]|jgi:RimJ/RimL family protein N-acetyltransferase